MSLSKDPPSYTEYWDEQLKRCREGYEVGGHKITGHHYSYLNFSEIQIAFLRRRRSDVVGLVGQKHM